jgi:hypothetical protein
MSRRKCYRVSKLNSWIREENDLPSRRLADGSPMDPPTKPGESVVRDSTCLRRLGLLDRESGLVGSTVTDCRLGRGAWGDKWDVRLACGTSADEPVTTVENE